jgi:hypothetical protein
MTIIDAHMHLFPDEASGLLAQGGEKLAGHAGVIEDVRAIAAATGITRFVALTTAIATVLRDFGQPEEQLWAQFESQNDWICELAAKEDLIAAGLGADPTLNSARVRDHLRNRIGRYDVAAIKVHPAIARVMPDDPAYFAIYDVARDARVPVVSHGGSSEGAFYESPIQYCAPANFAAVASTFPDVQFVIAHLGQPDFDALVTLGADYANVWTDLSFALGARLVSPEQLVTIVRAFGVERVMFGTDFPYFDPADSLNYLNDAGLADAELEAVTSGNAMRLFG